MNGQVVGSSKLRKGHINRPKETSRLYRTTIIWSGKKHACQWLEQDAPLDGCRPPKAIEKADAFLATGPSKRFRSVLQSTLLNGMKSGCQVIQQGCYKNHQCR